MRSDVELILK